MLKRDAPYSAPTNELAIEYAVSSIMYLRTLRRYLNVIVSLLNYFVDLFVKCQFVVNGQTQTLSLLRQCYCSTIQYQVAYIRFLAQFGLSASGNYLGFIRV